MSTRPLPRPLPPALAPFELLLEHLANRVAELLAERLALPDREERSPWMLIDAAAEYLGCSKHRLYKLTASGAIPHHKQDGRLFFHRTELDRWMAAHAQGERP